jgi:L-ascorbate oxidase
VQSIGSQRRSGMGSHTGFGEIASASLALAISVACVAHLTTPVDAGRAMLQSTPSASGGGSPLTPTIPVKRYDWRISFRKAAPDCFEKNILVVNGRFQPTIRVQRGHILEVNVYNDLPDNYPSITNGGVSIHWHGLSLRGEPWYDGVAFVQQCPIAPGQNFTYRFLVTDAPGTYFWHDHASGNHADGLAGPLIIEPEDGTPVLDQYDEERTVFLHDWFHTQGDVLAMSLNRPFDPARVTVGRGAWNWVQVPQAILINGKGYAMDCPLGPPPYMMNATCAVNRYTVAPGLAGQPMASSANPGCSHAALNVEANKTYLIRVVNAGTLNMQSLCFEGHRVSVVAADASPTEPLSVPCVDVNVGQRYDLLLTTNQEPRNYWITSASQYRTGSPNGFGVLHYAGAPNTTLPTTPPPQPGAIGPWSLSTINAVKSRAILFNATAAAPLQYPWPGNQTSLAVPPATRKYRIDISQPIVTPTGQLRWALNNIAAADTPTCSPLLEDIMGTPNFLRRQEVTPGYNTSGNGVLGQESSGDEPTGRDVYLDEVFPGSPVGGRHIARVRVGDVVDVLIQNGEASAFMGNPADVMRRNASEQHPFHLHGHHFWLLGTGPGQFNATNATLNTVNPAYRDTATVPPYGWVAFRFLADNRGTWLLHCHIFWHQFMGQTVVFSEEAELVKAPPRDLPTCPKKCPAQFAPWRPEYVAQQYRDTAYEIPLNAAASGQAGK